MITFKFSTFAGREFWKNWLPEQWQARIIAKRLMKREYKGARPYTVRVQMAHAVYDIIDRHGHVAPSHEPRVVVPL